MKVRLAPALVAGAATLAVAAPANAAAPPPSKFYFHCISSPNKIENASIVAGSFSGAAPTWDKNAPTTSYTAGGGCGFADAPVEGTSLTNIYDGVFGGTFGGAIDKMVVELHSLAVSKVRQGDTVDLHVRVGLDGEMVAERSVTVTPESSDTGASELFKFELTDLGIEAGDASRIVNITVDTPSGVSAWVYDATEIPSNVTIYQPDPDAPPATASASAKKARAAAKRRALARKRARR